MNQFYVSLIFIGIVLISISLIMIMLDRKKAFSFINNYEKKKQELVEIIYDAEQMIEELNKFSDYVVTQMDFKNEELRMNLNKAHEEIQALTRGLQLGKDSTGEIGNIFGTDIKESIQADISVKQAPAINGDLKMQAAVKEPVSKFNSEMIFEDLTLKKADLNTVVNKADGKGNEKVIPVNNKYGEVVRLFKAGMDHADIAKRLNLGKGEVQLILELNK